MQKLFVRFKVLIGIFIISTGLGAFAAETDPAPCVRMLGSLNGEVAVLAHGQTVGRLAPDEVELVKKYGKRKVLSADEVSANSVKLKESMEQFYAQCLAQSPACRDVTAQYLVSVKDETVEWLLKWVYHRKIFEREGQAGLGFASFEQWAEAEIESPIRQSTFSTVESYRKRSNHCLTEQAR